MKRQVYVNRTLNLKRINYIGFDMDHTLVRYDSQAFEALAHSMIVKKLVADKGYPEPVLNLPFDFQRAVRGLVIDKTHGNLLKLSRHGAIRVSYHGLKPIDYKAQKRMYKSTYVDLSDSNYDTVDTTFSIAHATLFAQLVDLKDANPQMDMPDYYTIADDVLWALDMSHRDDSLKSVVRSRLDDFVIKDEEIVSGLERYSTHGKKLFVLTNSDYAYAKLLLDYAITPFLKDHESWEDLFEFVITSAQKPRFFYDKLNFLKIDTQTGLMTNLESKIEPGVYQAGCASRLTSDLLLDPNEILYIGDHIYGDILRLKKDCAWRTALVVEELEEEVKKAAEALPFARQITTLMDKKVPLEKEVDRLISEQIENGHKDHEKELDKLMAEITALDKKIGPLIKKQQGNFNPYWGEIMRAGIEESYFAHQVERFACIYMARISDFLELSPRTYFRSFRHQMPHDPN